MTPTLAFDNVTDMASREAIPICNNLLRRCRVVLSNLSDYILGQFGAAACDCSPVYKPSTPNRVSNIVSVRPFKQVSWIDAWRIVTCMPRERFWPMEVGEVEDESRRAYPSLVVPNFPISLSILTELPEQAVIRVVIVECCEKFLESSTIGRHLRSFIASVLGQVRRHWRPALFSIAQEG